MPGKMDTETIKKAQKLFNFILLTEGKKVEKLSRTQAKNALKLVRETLCEEEKPNPDRRYNALCYQFGVVSPFDLEKICARNKDVAILSVVALRKNVKFIKQLKHLLKLHRIDANVNPTA